MLFSDAYLLMLRGYKVKRPCFVGHWYIDGKDGKIKIRLGDGVIISEGDLTLTIQNTLANDWIIV